MKKILLTGGGGHCRSIIDTLLALNIYDAIGIIDQYPNTLYRGIPVVGSDDNLAVLREEGWTDAFIAVGSVGDTALRRRLFALVKGAGYHIPSIIDPTAILADDVRMAEGCFVGKGAIVNAASCLGDCAIINSGAVVEHDCTIGRFAHVSSGAVLCGQVKISDDCHIGAASVVRQCICVGERTLIGAGSVVVKNLPANCTAYGNPCEVI